MKARLVVDAGPIAGKKFTLINGTGLGRQGDNDIVVNDPGISRHHLCFKVDDKGMWWVQDLGSSNGTFVNEIKIPGPTELQRGDHIRASSTIMTFEPPGA